MIAVISCYFNPISCPYRLANYKRFLKEIAKEDVDLFVVELSFEDEQEFQLTRTTEKKLIQIKSQDIMFQKERMLNILIEDLPDKYDKVMWMDCDLVYLDVGWAQRASEALEESPLVQPYSWAVGLPECKLSEPSPTHFVNYDCYAAGNIRKSFIFYYHHRKTFASAHGGHVGYVWAARRELLDRHKLYDPIITGAGDLFMTFAAIGNFSFLDYEQYLRHMSEEATNHFFDWAVPWYEDIRANVGYTNDLIMHLWHGDVHVRNYLYNSQCLGHSGFSPNKDLLLGEDRCWHWNRKNYWLHEALQDIFDQQHVTQKCK